MISPIYEKCDQHCHCKLQSVIFLTICILEDGVSVYEDVLNLTESSRTITNLRPDFNYRLCFYNCYLFDEKNYPLESCQIIRTGPSATSHSDTTVRQFQTARPKDDIIIGIIVGCFFIGVVISAVLYLSFYMKRTSRKQEKELPSLPPPPAYSRASISNNNHMSDLGNKRLTIDAAREFDVTLLPMPYDVGGGKSSRSSNLSNQFLTNTVDSVIYQEMESTTPSLVKSHLV